MTSIGIRLCAGALLAFGAAGCVGGYVYDARSGAALDGVEVTAIGSCAGSGCLPGEAVQHSAGDGSYVFDAYGKLHGSGDVQEVISNVASGAVGLSFDQPGFQLVYLWHHPVWSTYTDASGQSYQYSQVPAVYLCPVGAKDSDQDGLCDAAETRYGTSPTNPDSDGDGLSDGAEILGSNTLDFHYYGGSALHKDMYIYVDYYQAPIQAALDQVVKAFANAPLGNPDGQPGIALHIIMGQQIAAADQQANIIGPLAGDYRSFDKIKNKYLPSYWALVAHYVLFANQFDGSPYSGVTRGIPAHDSIITMGTWSPSGGTQQEQAGTFMHELGHQLGLQHGGDEGTNYKPNYISIMNYSYQMPGIMLNSADGQLDYSRWVLGSMSERSVSEKGGIPVAGNTQESELAAITPRLRRHPNDQIGTLLTGLAQGPLDFNSNGVIDTNNVSADLDGDGNVSSTFRSSQNDWGVLLYGGSSNGGGTIGAGAVMTAALRTSDGPKAMTFRPATDTPQLVTPAKMVPELGPR